MLYLPSVPPSILVFFLYIYIYIYLRTYEVLHLLATHRIWLYPWHHIRTNMYLVPLNSDGMFGTRALLLFYAAEAYCVSFGCLNRGRVVPRK
jgi:hypothetical protein